jgi:hypothetical protein
MASHSGVSHAAALDADLQARLESLREEGGRIWDDFDTRVRRDRFHPFVAADYACVERALLAVRQPGLQFLEWGSATGVITIMADMLGFEAFGIELDLELVDVARDLARRFDSRARFAAGSFIPTGYQWRSSTGDRRMATIGEGRSGYLELQHPLEDFDLVFAYPWSGEEPIMHDLMRRFGGAQARLLLLDQTGVHVYRRGQRV